MRQKRGKSFLLLPAGLLLVSASLVISRLGQVPDFARGCITGAGIGLMLLSFILPKLKPGW
jgi:hypothetical protein